MVGGGPYILLRYALISVAFQCPKVKEGARCGGKFMEPIDLGLFLVLPLCDLGQVT